MDLNIFVTKQEMGAAAARQVATWLNKAISDRGEANLILATGASQLEMMAHLIQQEVDWSRVTAFHLDEYIGMPPTHPASFRKYLQERFLDKVSGPVTFHFVDGNNPAPQEECQRLGALISSRRIDVACVGIGENGHLAFNDPPADFDTEAPYMVLNLDEACRRQQFGEGWFPTLEDVPGRAISMSIRQIMKSEGIVCTVPDARKAVAVMNAVGGPVTNQVPASILQEHPRCKLFLDNPAAALLSQERN